MGYIYYIIGDRVVKNRMHMYKARFLVDIAWAFNNLRKWYTLNITQNVVYYMKVIEQRCDHMYCT